nr:MAG TPA: hypothetical protein [Bacteriophage sp.]
MPSKTPKSVQKQDRRSDHKQSPHSFTRSENIKTEPGEASAQLYRIIITPLRSAVNPCYQFDI